MFAGTPMYTLYWAYDKARLKAMLGMSTGEYRVVRSRLGSFLRRTPQTRWLLRSLSAYVDADPITAVDISYINTITPLTQMQEPVVYVE